MGHEDRGAWPWEDVPSNIDYEPRYCLCADPENCIEPVPGRICKAGKSVANGTEAERGSQSDCSCRGADRDDGLHEPSCSALQRQGEDCK